MIKYSLTRIFNVIVTDLLFFIIICVGYLLLLIPGFIWFFMYGQAHFYSLIKGMGPFQALKASKLATNKSKRTLFNLYFLFGLVMSLIFGLPIQLVIIFHLPAYLLTFLQLFATYVYLINGYVIWKILDTNITVQGNVNS
jgi:uncharacterized membrane protein